MCGEVQTAGREKHSPVRKRDPLDEAAGVDVSDLAVLEQDPNIEGEGQTCERLAVRGEHVLLNNVNLDPRHVPALVKERRLRTDEGASDGDGKATNIRGQEGVGLVNRYSCWLDSRRRMREDPHRAQRQQTEQN